MGDNIYRKVDGEWVQHPEAAFHRPDSNNIRETQGSSFMEIDLSVDRVLIFDTFVYYGKDSIDFPQPLEPIRDALNLKHRKCKVFEDPELVEAASSHLVTAVGVLAEPTQFDPNETRRPHIHDQEALDLAMAGVHEAFKAMSHNRLWKATTSRPNASGYSHTSAGVRRGFRCESMVFGKTGYGPNTIKDAVANVNCPEAHEALRALGRALRLDVDNLSFTVNKNFQCQPHKDGNNVGTSVIVGFGDYTGGQLAIKQGDIEQHFDIRYEPLVFNGACYCHWVNEFEGDRYTVVMYIKSWKPPNAKKAPVPDRSRPLSPPPSPTLSLTDSGFGDDDELKDMDVDQEMVEDSCPESADVDVLDITSDQVKNIRKRRKRKRKAWYPPPKPTGRLGKSNGVNLFDWDVYNHRLQTSLLKQNPDGTYINSEHPTKVFKHKDNFYGVYNDTTRNTAFKLKDIQGDNLYGKSLDQMEEGTVYACDTGADETLFCVRNALRLITGHLEREDVNSYVESLGPWANVKDVLTNLRDLGLRYKKTPRYGFKQDRRRWCLVIPTINGSRQPHAVAMKNRRIYDCGKEMSVEESAFTGVDKCFSFNTF